MAVDAAATRSSTCSAGPRREIRVCRVVLAMFVLGKSVYDTYYHDQANRSRERESKRDREGGEI
jgi:hypothetical protein